MDARYGKRAEELLYGELAAALGIPRTEVEEYIAERAREEAARTPEREN